MPPFRMPGRLCPTAGCPFCVDPQQHTDKDYGSECFDMAVRRADGQCSNAADVGKYTPRQESRSHECTDPMHYLCNHCFQGWQEASNMQHIPRDFTNQCIQCNETKPQHPHTRNAGMARPSAVSDNDKVALVDQEVWFTKWEAQKLKLQGKTHDCYTLACVMDVMKQYSRISDTQVAESRWIAKTPNGVSHNGLFEINKRIAPGEVCAVLCSDLYFHSSRPNDRPTYHIQGMPRRPQRFIDYSIDINDAIIGAAANSHFRRGDPKNNAVYKQLPVFINESAHALTVLVAQTSIPVGAEVIVDYGGEFNHQFDRPMQVHGLL